MKTTHLLHALIPFTLLHQPVTAATLTEYFEDGEDTTAWNSTWTNGTTTTGFLDPSLGGESAGTGASNVQTFSRSFKDNTAGLSVTTAYSLSMYVQVNAFGSPSDGRFEIVDGQYGSSNAANLGIRTEETSPGVFTYHWQARNSSNVWQDFGIDLDLTSPYRVFLDVNPVTFTYSATVQLVTPTGSITNSATLADITFDPNVITNGQNGNLLFYIQASSGTTTALVDNINVFTIPEPSALALLVPGVVMLAARRCRPGRTGAGCLPANRRECHGITF
ncbi:MAG: hypothetical protein EOP87_22790 [Verrucomicrobiaceae bacterium]|nr:MAG: hypothetical protein EOP87_22790 [Verrucomicrobiaceae bacterium]